MALNNLREKLLEAGLVDEGQVKQAEADEARRAQRVRAKGKGGKSKSKGKGGKSKSKGKGGRGGRGRDDGPAKPATERLTPEELAAAEAKRAEREKQAALDRERAENRRRAAEERQKAEDIRRVADALGLDAAGDKVFFFQDRKGRIKRMLVSAEVEAKLGSGELAIIEHPLPHAIEHAVVPREGAEAVLKIAERSVRFYNRGPDEHYGSAG